jgi:hypothetical protein
MKTSMYRLGVNFGIDLEREIFLLLCRGEGADGDAAFGPTSISPDRGKELCITGHQAV